MAYATSALDCFLGWIESGVLPPLRRGDAVFELGAQAFNVGTSRKSVERFVKHFDVKFDGAALADKFPVTPECQRYTGEIWTMAGLKYLAYDITEEPHSRIFDLNFDSVAPHEAGRAKFVTNLGTTEHVANQFNAFKVAHDLLSVGGVAYHSVPFTGMLNHGLINYNPKFFFSLIVNNRYRLRYLNYSTPQRHADFGENNQVFDGDSLMPSGVDDGTITWQDKILHSGVVNLLVERVHEDAFVPPVDFARGYYGEIGSGDLAALMTETPHSTWSDAFRRGVTPHQTKKPTRLPSLGQKFFG